MNTSFYIKEDRLNECKIFVRSLPSARFNHNPLKQGNEWFISLTMEVHDGNKLNELFNKWHEEDKPKGNINKGFLKRLFSKFYF